jgi:hypothetical protein
MACSLKQHGNTPYDFTANPGAVNLTIVQPNSPAGASVQFAPTDPAWAITDQHNQNVNYQLANNNQSLTFTAVTGNSYSLTLPFFCMPSSAYGLLQEDCPNSALDLSLISVNHQAQVSIVC